MSPRRSRGRQATAADQVVRMLALVPFISRRPGIRVTELAREFGVDEKQIIEDLNVLMMCGEPGYYPNDLIDVVFDDEDGSVSIGHHAGLDQPVRLSPDEVVSLSVALRVLADLPGLLDDDAVHSALEKLEMLPGGHADGVAIAPADPGPALAVVRRAIDEHRRIRMTYYSASRDDIGERDVDPIRVFVIDGRSYLEGYCYVAQAIRRFRIDRIDAVQELGVAAQQPLWHDSEVPSALFTPGSNASTVTIELANEAMWVAEYYGAQTIAESDTSRTVRLVAPDDEWIVRLVLSLGGAAQVVDRPDLSTEVDRRAREALGSYGAARQ